MASAWLVLLLAFIASASAAGADERYLNLSTWIEANKEAIARLGSTTAPAVLPVEFPCQLVEKPTSPPTSIHKLRPSDINIVAGIGDSITAAFGAESSSPLNLFNEYRGVSWSAGGQDSFELKATMPNILKVFNDKLYGYATGTGGPNSAEAVFNIAVTGAVAADLPAQARRLVEIFSTSPHVNFTHDWKLVTVWIGGNDLCAVCNDPELYSVKNYQGHLITTLDILQQIPRVFVNLVSIMDITRLHQLQYGLCDTYHKLVCPCVQKSDETRERVAIVTQSYQQATVEISQMGRFQTDTFAVIVQPFFVNTLIPLNPDGSVDRSYFAPDCFHFSAKAQAAAGTALWNNMLEPQGSKSNSWTLGQPPKCPTREKPYLCTATNQCGASTDVQDANTGGKAPAPALTIEQRAMLSMSLVLIVAVPAAIFIYLRIRRRNRERAGYTKLDGSINADPSKSKAATTPAAAATDV